MCEQCDNMKKEIERLKDENELLDSVADEYRKTEKLVENRLIDTIIGDIETFKIKGLTLCDIDDIADFRLLP